MCNIQHFLIKKKLYYSKIDWIKEYIVGKNVLDLGCVAHNLKKMKGEWLHRMIVDNANSVVGVDILYGDVKRLNKMGYNVICANVEELNLNRKFDVIVAGDLIEHLSNCGHFFKNIERHLLEKGMLLITTPNPFTILRFFRLLFDGYVPANKEHTYWFSYKVLNQLVNRYGLEITDILSSRHIVTMK